MKTDLNILFQGKLGNCLKRDNGEHDSIRREVKTVDDPFVVKLSLGIGYPSSRPFAVKLSMCYLESNILRCEVEIGSEIGKLFVDNQSSIRYEVELVCPFVVELNLCCLEWHDILRRGVEITGGPFVVKLSLDLDILRCEVEIQVLYVAGRHDSLRCEVETVDDPFIVKFGFELDIFRREVEIYSRANCVALSSISFAVKLKLTLTETGKLFCCQTVAPSLLVLCVLVPAYGGNAFKRFDGVSCMLLYWKCSLIPSFHGQARIVRCLIKEFV
ncbi:hypothetical protein F3Y22_tig00113123pilonHSYRG00255 [Hibiscus syriacus]|uniref:Uncharacterized protein n=1 Tax=Hibiscus syriacus TaxID=106335 RepID=A0A6A2X387_HIBSY|nr:hypothetical protein F3Y22_tig00113123pilonHSYRG00255 [Hibiscus syriacus]